MESFFLVVFYKMPEFIDEIPAQVLDKCREDYFTYLFFFKSIKNKYLLVLFY